MILKIEKKLIELDAIRPFKPNLLSKRKCFESKDFERIKFDLENNK